MESVYKKLFFLSESYNLGDCKQYLYFRVEKEFDYRSMMPYLICLRKNTFVSLSFLGTRWTLPPVSECVPPKSVK